MIIKLSINFQGVINSFMDLYFISVYRWGIFNLIVDLI